MQVEWQVTRTCAKSGETRGHKMDFLTTLASVPSARAKVGVKGRQGNVALSRRTRADFTRERLLQRERGRLLVRAPRL